MARPLKQGLDYFPHDTDAINDKKIQRLIDEYGLAGYGFYFALLADIYSGLPEPYKWGENVKIFAHRCRLSVAKAQRMLSFCVEICLFDADNFNNNSTLISQSIFERAESILKVRDAKRKQRLSSGLSSGLSAISQTQSKLNQSKTKDKEIDKEKCDISLTDNLPPIKKEPVTAESPELTSVIQAFEDCGGTIATPMIAQELADAEREYGSQIVIAGFRRASTAGKSGVRIINYCRPIWEDYKANGIPQIRSPDGKKSGKPVEGVIVEE